MGASSSTCFGRLGMAWRCWLNRIEQTWRAKARESKGVFDSAPLIFIDETPPRGSRFVVGKVRLPLRNAPIFFPRGDYASTSRDQLCLEHSGGSEDGGQQADRATRPLAVRRP